MSRSWHTKELLAYDFAHGGEAREAARSIATSYSEHGYDSLNENYWFRGEAGVLRSLV